MRSNAAISHRISDTLDNDGVLYPGDSLVSENGLYTLLAQLDGNLVLYDENWAVLWASGTSGYEDGFTILQEDGNFVFYDGDNVARWAIDQSLLYGLATCAVALSLGWLATVVFRRD